METKRIMDASRLKRRAMKGLLSLHSPESYRCRVHSKSKQMRGQVLAASRISTGRQVVSRGDVRELIGKAWWAHVGTTNSPKPLQAL